MKIRILPGLSVITLAVFGLLFWQDISNVFFPVNNLPIITEKPIISEENPATQSEEQTHALKTGESIGLPVKIIIPAIDVNATVEEVALAGDGNMDVPKHYLNTGWYKLGPRPGETGNAVIAGHADWINGAAAVFADLSKLNPGDPITVQDDKGALIAFTVRESRLYDAKADATDVFISNDGKAHLNIITCDGPWDKKTNQYSKRLIIFADKSDSEKSIY